MGQNLYAFAVVVVDVERINCTDRRCALFVGVRIRLYRIFVPFAVDGPIVELVAIVRNGNQHRGGAVHIVATASNQPHRLIRRIELDVAVRLFVLIGVIDIDAVVVDAALIFRVGHEDGIFSDGCVNRFEVIADRVVGENSGGNLTTCFVAYGRDGEPVFRIRFDFEHKVGVQRHRQNDAHLEILIQAIGIRESVGIDGLAALEQLRVTALPRHRHGDIAIEEDLAICRRGLQAIIAAFGFEAIFGGEQRSRAVRTVVVGVV